MNIEDSQLITQIINGNKEAERKLYKKYKELLRRYLNIKYPNNFDLDDDVSEILIKIFESYLTYDKSKSKFSTWVVSIAKNYMIDKSRKNLNNPITASFTHDGNISFFSITNSISDINSSFTSSAINFVEPQSLYQQPDQKIENKDSLDFISNRIGLQDFHLLNMKYGQGYDYKDMEKEMKKDSSSISNRVNYLKSKLKKEIKRK